MKPFSWPMVALLLLGVPLVLVERTPAQSETTIEDAERRIKPKPDPKWIKIIDRGSNNPRLKGYFTPEGQKV